MKPQSSLMMSSMLVVVVFVCCQLAASGVEAGQGCPFDDGSCQEYCGQQGCSMGYCGHFAWIQCICRKCGDEWSWYDKVHYNPDKTVNQTELDSLKLNATSPLILTDSSAGAVGDRADQQKNATSTGTAADNSKPEQQQRATLTTLLIPDLSDSSKLDLNDIPDENSDKFLDYLAKNHERLVQATSSKDQTAASKRQQQQQTGDDQLTAEEAGGDSTSSPADDETVEIQISSNDNSPPASQQQTTDSPPTSPDASSTSTASPAPGSESPAASSSSSTTTSQPSQQKSPLIRLIQMASDEQLFDSSEQ